MDNIEVLKIYADWCQPCRIYDRVFNKVTEDLHVKTTRINIDQEQERAQTLGVISLPTTIILRDGEPVARKTGALRDADLRQLIASAV